MKYSLYILFVFLLLANGCDKGLAPPPPQEVTSLSGSVHFTGEFPPCDSVRILAVVLSRRAAPFSVGDIIAEYNKTIFIAQLAPCSFKDTSFSFTLKPGLYNYLGVAQNYGDSLLKDWRIVGFAHDALDSAIHFDLKTGDHPSNIILRVRFDSLSRQPFIK